MIDKEVYDLTQTGDEVQAILNNAEGMPTPEQLSEAFALKANVSDVYTKNETYTKSEVNRLVGSPEQNYVTVDDYASLPATGRTDTIYRVANYDGENEQVDVTKYSEYAWNGTSYTLLCVKSQIGEVFDISDYNDATYANLSAALGADGANVPQSIRRGGMSIKFIQSSDNKYVQYRLMSDTFNTAVANWQGMDEEPVVGSENLVNSGGVALDRITSEALGGVIHASYIPNPTEIPFNAKQGELLTINYYSVVAGNAGIRIYYTDTTCEELSGHQTDKEIVLGKDVEKIKVIYSPIKDVDIRVRKENYTVDFLKGGTYRGALKRGLPHKNCNLNKGATVYGHIEGAAGTALRFLYNDNTIAEFVIPQDNSYLDFNFVTEKTVTEVYPAISDITDCSLTIREADTSECRKYVEDITAGKNASIIGNMERAVRVPFIAEDGDTLHITINGSAGTGVSLYNGNTLYSQIFILTGETSYSKDIILGSHIDYIAAAYGNLTEVSITKTAYSEYSNIVKLQRDQAVISGIGSTLNLWDDDFEFGNINLYGEYEDSTVLIRSKNFIRVIPGSIATITVASNYKCRFKFFDENEDFVGSSSTIQGTTGTITVPYNAYYIKIICGEEANIAYSKTGTIVSFNTLPKAVASTPLKYFNEEKGILCADRMTRAERVPFWAKLGDKIHVKLNGTAGVGLSFYDGTTLVEQALIPSGETSYEDVLVFDKNVNFVSAAYGSISNVVLSVERADKWLMPIFAPAPQKPANADTDSDFNAETITSELLYSAYDGLINKCLRPAYSNFDYEGYYPKYINEHNIEGNDASNTYKLKTYVLSKRNRYAWIASYPRYAWAKSGSTKLRYTDSCCPRAGDILYINPTGSSDYGTITSYNSVNGLLVDSDVFEKKDNDYVGDVVFTKDVINTSVAVFNKGDQNLGNSIYIDSTHISFDGKTYERCESLDYHTDNKYTIFLWANEHAAQSDPAECAIVCYRLAKDLCLGTDNPFINFLRNYCKVVIIPVANPYGMNKWVSEHREGRTNYNDVNINRNYDTPGWESLTDTDKGSAAGSENETQYIMNMVKFFNPDIAIDLHALGYAGTNSYLSEGRCHYKNGPQQVYIDRAVKTMLTLGLRFSNYGAGDPEHKATGSDWINKIGIKGGLIEMNTGLAAASYDGNQHTEMVMMADYTLLLNAIRMWMAQVDEESNLSSMSIL